MLREEEPSRVHDPHGNGVQVRVLCTTNRILEREVQKGNFRGDLFYLLNVVSFRVPPLRERKEDIPALADYFVRFYSDRFSSPAPPLNDPLLKTLVEHDWPGNIRELENVMKRYVILGTPESITTMKPSTTAQAEGFSFDVPENGAIHLKELKRQAIRELEAKVISRALRESRWNRKRAARTLNISYRSLLGKLRAAGLDRSENQ
jgi:DNA-binding NtrC family response regulator